MEDDGSPLRPPKVTRNPLAASIPYDVILGVDPGVTQGAIGVIDLAGKYLEVHDCPSIKYTTTTKTKSGKFKEKTLVEHVALASLIRGIKERYGRCLMIVEKVSPMPTDGAVTAFTFAGGYYCWLTAGACFDIPVFQVTPTVWKRAMFAGTQTGSRVEKSQMTKDERYAENKKASMLLARQLFPSAAGTVLTRKLDDGRAEALLLAEYSRRSLLSTGFPVPAPKG